MRAGVKLLISNYPVEREGECTVQKQHQHGRPKATIKIFNSSGVSGKTCILEP